MSVSQVRVVNLDQSYFSSEITDNTEAEESIIGGILFKANYVWLAKGPRFEVKNCKTGKKVGSWTFGSILQDYTTKILFVKEIERPNGRVPLLVIALDCIISGGTLCIFDFIGSKVLRAIQIVEKVTSIHVIDHGNNVPALSGPLSNFDGILAVGTVGGNVYIVDICRQSCDEGYASLCLRDELKPCKTVVLTIQDIPDIENFKRSSLRSGDHLAIHLNAVLEPTEHFILKGPKNDDRLLVNKVEVEISALHYCPQLGSLLIGYNFGAFQLWNLMNFTLVYTSPDCDEHIPITKFAIQEPADDPRAFCYIWAVYSSDVSYSEGFPQAVMYAFSYESKECIEGFGMFYENFQYCAVRFQLELNLNCHFNLPEPKMAHCISLDVVLRDSSNRNLGFQDNRVESDDLLSLCFISWVVNCGKEFYNYMVLFDLNQWYKEQMPKLPTWDDCSNYMIYSCINDILSTENANNRPLMSISMDKESLRQFTGPQKLEEHFCPTSLSFAFCCIQENNIIFAQHRGLQKSLLCQIESAGPLCLIRPADFYQEVVRLGMTPLFVELPVNVPISLSQQREVLLNVALEQKLTGWLCKCVSEWANGSYSSTGCTLDLLLSWALQRVTVLKSNCDKFCIPLFDYSEMKLDTNTSRLLNNCIIQIKNVCSIYNYAFKFFKSHINNIGLVEDQFRYLRMISIYFEVLQWMLNIGLLPECPVTLRPKMDDLDRVNAPYPGEKLSAYYNDRRAMLQQKNFEHDGSKDSLLFIDNLIEKECKGKELRRQWQRDGGSGLYPPPSLQALLRTYLLDGVDVTVKHVVVIYVFLDLAMALDQEDYKPIITNLIKFPAVFQIRPSIIKITQAFWQLDHGDFSTAMEQLLDPLINRQDLQYWHHKIAMKSMFLQEQQNFALLYKQVNNPPVLDEEDVLIGITLFVSNKMLDEAFYFEKKHRNVQVGNKFIIYLYKEANKFDLLETIMNRNLTRNQEEAFLKYLSDIGHPKESELKILFNLSRCRFIEAFNIYDSQGVNPERKGLVAQEHAKAVDQLVYCYKHLLPPISRNLIDICRKENVELWKRDVKQTPLSSDLASTSSNRGKTESFYHSALLKARQTFRTPWFSRNVITEEVPFLRPPVLVTSEEISKVQVIVPKVIGGEDYSPAPSKLMRVPLNISPDGKMIPSHLDVSKLETPIVKRKVTRRISVSSSLFDDSDARTPQSILKGSNVPRKNDDTVYIAEEPTITDAKIAFEISGRKSIQRTPTVRFDVPRLSSSTEESSLESPQTVPLRSPISDKINSNLRRSPVFDIIDQQSSSKNSSATTVTEEVFYSPDTSMNEDEDKNDKRQTEFGEGFIDQGQEKKEINDDKNKECTIEHKECADESANELDINEDNRCKQHETLTAAEDILMEGGSFNTFEPKMSTSELKTNQDIHEESMDLGSSISKSLVGRRSYRKNIDLTVPPRSSPRLAKQTTPINLESSTTKITPIDGYSKESPIRKLQPRRLLREKVLEQNAFSFFQTFTSNNCSESKSTIIEKSSSTLVASQSSISASPKILTKSKVEVSDTYELDVSDSKQVVRKVHKETKCDSKIDTTSVGSKPEKILIESKESQSICAFTTEAACREVAEELDAFPPLASEKLVSQPRLDANIESCADKNETLEDFAAYEASNEHLEDQEVNVFEVSDDLIVTEKQISDKMVNIELYTDEPNILENVNVSPANSSMDAFNTAMIMDVDEGAADSEDSKNDNTSIEVIKIGSSSSEDEAISVRSSPAKGSFTSNSRQRAYDNSSATSDNSDSYRSTSSKSSFSSVKNSDSEEDPFVNRSTSEHRSDSSLDESELEIIEDSTGAGASSKGHCVLSIKNQRVKGENTDVLESLKEEESLKELLSEGVIEKAPQIEDSSKTLTLAGDKVILTEKEKKDEAVDAKRGVSGESPVPSDQCNISKESQEAEVKLHEDTEGSLTKDKSVSTVITIATTATSYPSSESKYTQVPMTGSSTSIVGSAQQEYDGERTNQKEAIQDSGFFGKLGDSKFRFSLDATRSDAEKTVDTKQGSKISESSQIFLFTDLPNFQEHTDKSQRKSKFFGKTFAPSTSREIDNDLPEPDKICEEGNLSQNVGDRKKRAAAENLKETCEPIKYVEGTTTEYWEPSAVKSINQPVLEQNETVCAAYLETTKSDNSNGDSRAAAEIDLEHVKEKRATQKILQDYRFFREWGDSKYFTELDSGEFEDNIPETEELSKTLESPSPSPYQLFIDLPSSNATPEEKRNVKSNYADKEPSRVGHVFDATNNLNECKRDSGFFGKTGSDEWCTPSRISTRIAEKVETSVLLGVDNQFPKTDNYEKDNVIKKQTNEEITGNLGEIYNPVLNVKATTVKYLKASTRKSVKRQVLKQSNAICTDNPETNKSDNSDDINDGAAKVHLEKLPSQTTTDKRPPVTRRSARLSLNSRESIPNIQDQITVEPSTSTANNKRRKPSSRASSTSSTKTSNRGTRSSSADLEIDRIKLLDRENFRGKPDPDESKIYETSPPTNITSASGSPDKKRRTRSRSQSLASESSVAALDSSPTSTKVKPKGRVTTRSGAKTTTRKNSLDQESVQSETSPPKRNRKTKKGNESESDAASESSIAMSTRSRSRSTSPSGSVKSAASSRQTRSRRIISNKSNLPEITEEPNL